MSKIYRVTMPRLQRALTKVTCELNRHGLWDDYLEDVEVFLVPLGWGAYGWQEYWTTGEICIPAICFTRFYDYFFGSYCGLADVLRHEYAHALAYTHRGLFRSREFCTAFDGAHNATCAPRDYDPDFHFTGYSTTNPSEDFAETFMFYLRHGGRLPSRHDTRPKRKKWRFVQQLAGRVCLGRRRW